jgi:peptidoglycan/xylan/chitin deacetylase (PgdA/CDA1 family)
MRGGHTVLILAVNCLLAFQQQLLAGESFVRDEYGAVIRGDIQSKKSALVFTGDKFGEGLEPILDTLKARRLRGSFFLTGNFLRNSKFEPLVERIVQEGHYLGPHSDAHLLYSPWDDRQRNLVSRSEFADDLHKNLAALQAVEQRPPDAPVYFIPPYEWYNADHVRWSAELGLTLINFTPGSGSNRDYAREGDPRFIASRRIYDDILAYEQKDPHGLNGFLLLLHVGSGRRDPFHPRLAPLCDELARRGYAMVRVDELLSAASRRPDAPESSPTRQD